MGRDGLVRRGVYLGLLISVLALVFLDWAADVDAFLPSTIVHRSSSGELRQRCRVAHASSETTTVAEAKENLRRALDESKGSTVTDNVVAAIEMLSELNPTESPGRAWPLLTGDWISKGEDFVGTNRTEAGLECTLGQLAFNIFEPIDLPILITSIGNKVGTEEIHTSATESSTASPSGERRGDAPSAGSLASAGTHTYSICTNFVTRDEKALRGRLILEGSCEEHPKRSDRLNVRFLSGYIEPDDGQDLDAWCAVIGQRDGASKKRLKARAVELMLKLVFGYRPPRGGLGEHGEMSYTMTRPPKGSLDILYLDEELRVTRGQRGSVIIVERA